MNYELAKELKDAGFDQTIADFGLSHYYIGNNKIGYLTHDGSRDILAHDDDYKEDWAKIPTLSELIEAVRVNKDNHFSLIYNDEWCIYEEPKENRWQARYYPQTPIGFCEEEGTTPEEAVAKLWLALNKK